MKNFCSIFKEKLAQDSIDNVGKIVQHMNRRDSTLIGKEMLNNIKRQINQAGDSRIDKLKAIENF